MSEAAPIYSSRESDIMEEEIVVGKASSSSTFERLPNEDTPGPATFSRQNSLTVSQETTPAPPEPSPQPEKQTLIYYAGPSYVSGRRDENRSARLKQAGQSQLLVPSWSESNIVRLQSVDPHSSRHEWNDEYPRISIPTDIKILHPDCLLKIETTGASTVLAIDKADSRKYVDNVIYYQAWEPGYGFADFLHDMCINASESKDFHSKALKSGNFHNNYKFALLANREVYEYGESYEEVVTESNWGRFFQDKQNGMRWKFDLYLVEVCPAGESGEWETLLSKKSSSESA